MKKTVLITCATIIAFYASQAIAGGACPQSGTERNNRSHLSLINKGTPTTPSDSSDKTR